jgi:ATP phosphoribosyltransferase regulatory subunit
LIFADGGHLRPAQQLACQLRKQGYSVARDILPRSREAALDYAKYMNYKYLAVVAGEAEAVVLIDLASGLQQQLPWQQLYQNGL